VRDLQHYGHYAIATTGVDYPDGEADALWVGVPGTLTVRRPDGTDVSFTTTLNHAIIPVRSIRTTHVALAVVALYRGKGVK